MAYEIYTDLQLAVKIAFYTIGMTEPAQLPFYNADGISHAALASSMALELLHRQQRKAIDEEVESRR